MSNLVPPVPLPPGAVRWATLEDVAIITKKEVRTIKHWCDQGLFHVADLAAGYGGRWVAVNEGNWPVTNPEGAAAYRKRRSASARIGGVKGSEASVRARKAKPKAKSASRRSA